MTDSSTAGSQTTPIKTYTQRILEMESIIQGHSESLQGAQKSFDFIAETVQELISGIHALSDQVQAMYQVAEEGKPVTRSNVEAVLLSQHTEKLKQTIDKIKASGKVDTSDSVTSLDDIVVFEGGESIPYGYARAFDFKDEVKATVVGKKVGDKLTDETSILEVLVFKKESSNVQEQQAQ